MKQKLIEPEDVFCNSYGAVRVAFVRREYGLHKIDGSSVKCQIQPLTNSDLGALVHLFVNWRDLVELMPLRLTYREQHIFYAPDLNTTSEIYRDYLNNHGVKAKSYLDFVFVEGYRYEWVAKKSCKRGNDVYTKLVHDKFKPLFDSKDHQVFFSTKINKNRKRIRKTNLLYVTGTCDQKITGDIAHSWLLFGKYWNSFITNVREQFNGAEYIRAWQSQENGYPHFHALIYFPEFEFTAVRWREESGKYSWRVHNRQKHRGKLVRDRLKDAWLWGNLDIKCCDDSKKALVDIVKYITRDLEGGESDLTNAMVWYFGKQSYSISRGFTSLFNVDIDLAEPGNADLINSEAVITRSNSKNDLVRIEVFPLVRRDLLDFSYQKDVMDLARMEDPPPKVVDYFDKLALDCRPVSFRTNAEGVDIVVYKRVD
jgi:hypothetical protein